MKYILIVFISLIVSNAKSSESFNRNLYKECKLNTEFCRGYITGYMSGTESGVNYKELNKYCFPLSQDKKNYLITNRQLRYAIILYGESIELSESGNDGFNYSDNMFVSKSFSKIWPCD